MKDYYLILNIKITSSNEEIKKAYRLAALFWHPDKNKSLNSSEKFIEINEAYNILIDSEKRKVYNRLYESYFKNSANIQIYASQKSDSYYYEQWVKEERIKAEKLAHLSIDNILTESFHFIDKYGWLIVLLFFIFGFIIIMIVVK